MAPAKGRTRRDSDDLGRRSDRSALGQLPGVRSEELDLLQVGRGRSRQIAERSRARLAPVSSPAGKRAPSLYLLSCAPWAFDAPRKTGASELGDDVLQLRSPFVHPPKERPLAGHLHVRVGAHSIREQNRRGVGGDRPAGPPGREAAGAVPPSAVLSASAHPSPAIDGSCQEMASLLGFRRAPRLPPSMAMGGVATVQASR